jgi:hypothetical protein
LAPPPHEKKETPDHKVLTTIFKGHKPGWVKVQLMIQRVPDVAGKMCTVLSDTGAQIMLLTQQYVKEAVFKGCPASLQTSGVGYGNKKKSKIQYIVILKKINGSVGEVQTIWGR